MLKLDRARVAQSIRHAREAAGLTQARLAEAAGIAEQSLSRLERGAYEPALSTVWAIAHVLGVSLDELVDGPAQPKRHADDDLHARVMMATDRFGDLPPKAATLFRKLAQEFLKAQAPAIETALVADRRRGPKRR
jgi:transcriptional regulator with XRE-family HTH domain